MKIVENNEPLKAIICGFEHSGTTLVSEILRQHPQLDSGFEGGFLLNETAEDFLKTEPFYTNAKGGWGISDDDLKYITTVDNWPELYTRLRERAEVIKDKNTWLFDKTPRYMGYLQHVLERVPNVPCIVIVKDLRAVVWSSFKRTKLTLDDWYKSTFQKTCNHILFYTQSLQKAIENGYSKRLLVINYEKLCLNPREEAEKFFDFIGLDFSETYLNFEDVKYRHVHGSRVSTQYLVEYKNYLPVYICDEILKMTEEHQIMKNWLWLSDNTELKTDKVIDNTAINSVESLSNKPQILRNNQSLLYAIFDDDPYKGLTPDYSKKDVQERNNPLFTEVIQYLKPSVVVEVGTWKGGSAIRMAKLVKQMGLNTVIICIDTWLGSPEHWLNKKPNKPWSFDNLKVKNGYPTLYYTFLNNVLCENLQDIIVPLPMPSESAVVVLKELKVSANLIYIDAAHEYESALRDIKCFWNLLSNPGIMIGDDYIKWEGVTKAANEFANQNKLDIFGQVGKFLIPKGKINPCIMLS
jgi:hypothetical protein